jgi:hypothetical protein
MKVILTKGDYESKRNVMEYLPAGSRIDGFSVTDRAQNRFEKGFAGHLYIFPS